MARQEKDARSRLEHFESDERGIALVLTLMALALLSALGLALVLTTSTETGISGNYRDSREALHAADAGLERAVQDLLTVPDWDRVLAGTTTSGFVDGSPGGVRVLPDGSTLDLSHVVNLANCEKITACTGPEMDASTPERPWGANNPRFQLYAYGPVADLLPTGTIDSKYYVVVMVADDPAETDADPLHDGVALDNPGRGVLTLRAEAFGPGGAHTVVETSIARTDNTELERGYSGQRGQDEQNRRARKAAVETPGKALTRSEMSVSGGGLAVQ
ncbi:MAG: PilX N-terminal domain-containing pilus assembly protein [Vicinamibacterales bacterium]